MLTYRFSISFCRPVLFGLCHNLFPHPRLKDTSTQIQCGDITASTTGSIFLQLCEGRRSKYCHPQWHAYVAPALWEAEAGISFEFQRLQPSWATKQVSAHRNPQSILANWFTTTVLLEFGSWFIIRNIKKNDSGITFVLIWFPLKVLIHLKILVDY